jgi:hypothetical protein
MRTTDRHLPQLLSLALAAALLAACGPAEEPAQPIDGDDLATGEQALAATNGLSLNGLNRNGLNRNGLNRNGLNGVGLAKPEFKTWFNEDVASSDQVMKYFYGCAAKSTSTLAWTNPTTGKAYSWKGALGLAPAWTGGTPATVAEQQVITACMAAHVNKYGLGVPIAVEGRTATGTQIAIAAGELTTYSVREACFFGNLFNGEGVFGGPDHSSWNAKTSTARACVFDTDYKDSMSQCAPIYQIGFCSSNCAKDPTNTFYETCTYNGKAYKALATRIRPAEVYTCGDGVCQLTESCGSGANWDSCEEDCGQCP